MDRSTIEGIEAENRAMGHEHHMPGTIEVLSDYHRVSQCRLCGLRIEQLGRTTAYGTWTVSEGAL